MTDRINATEFARRDGCNEKQVRRGIANGHLERGADGLIDSAAVGTGWRSHRAGRKPKADKLGENASGAAIAPSPAAAPAPAAAAPAHVPASAYAAANARKEVAIASMKELELASKQGKLADIDAARAVVFEEFRAHRNAWLAWPSIHAADIAAELDVEPDKVIEVLTAHVRQQLIAIAAPTPDFAAAHDR